MTVQLLLLAFCANGSAQPIPGFGPPDDAKPVVGFGLEAEVALAIEAAHWEHTVGYMKRVDPNQSGYLERNELSHFSDIQFRQSDLNGDGRLSIHEKALEDLVARNRGVTGRRKQTETILMDGLAVNANDRRSAADTIKKCDKNQNGVIENNLALTVCGLYGLSVVFRRLLRSATGFSRWVAFDGWPQAGFSRTSGHVFRPRSTS